MISVWGERSDLSDPWDKLPACLLAEDDRLEAYPKGQISRTIRTHAQWLQPLGVRDQNPFQSRITFPDCPDRIVTGGMVCQLEAISRQSE